MEFKIGSLMNLISGKSNKETSSNQVTQPKIIFKAVDKKKKNYGNETQGKTKKLRSSKSADFIPLESSSLSKFSRGKLNQSFKNLRNKGGRKPEIAENSSTSVVGKSFRYTGSQHKTTVQGDATDGGLPKQRQPADEEKLNRTVFVGNLPLTQISESCVEKLFAPFGEIESFRLRSIPVKDIRISKKVAAIKKDFHPDRTSTNAYVVMKRPEAAAAALALNGKIIDNHHIRVDNAEPSGENDPRKAIFLGNVSFKAEDDDLWALFGECGEIESVHILRDRHTNVSKGAAYVNFKSTDSVELALKMSDLEIHGRPLVVRRCLPGHKKATEPSSRQPGPRNKDGPVDDKARSKEEKRFRKKMKRREKREQENARNEALGLRSRPLKEMTGKEKATTTQDVFCGVKADEQQKRKKKRINKGEIQRKKVAKILTNVKKEVNNCSRPSEVVNMDVEPTPSSADVVLSETADTEGVSSQARTSKGKKNNLGVKTKKMKQKAKKIFLEENGGLRKKKLKKKPAT